MNFDQLTKLPKRINPCPIAEAVVEIRFDTQLPREVVIGIIYNEFKDRYSNFSTLPITQLPVNFVDNQPNLKYAPHYRLDNENFVFQIGPRSFSIICPKEYKGWESYFKEIALIFNRINSLNIIKTSERLGLRYVNFFKEIDIFEQINGEVLLGGNSLIKNLSTIRTEFDINDFQCALQITNNCLLEGKTKGSSIDIDLSSQDIVNPKLYEKIITAAHEIEKKLFFGILKSDFLATLNPEY